MDDTGGSDSPDRARGSEGRFIKERPASNEDGEIEVSFKEKARELPCRRMQDDVPFGESSRRDNEPSQAGKRGRWSTTDKAEQGDLVQGPNADHVPRSGQFFEHDQRGRSAPQRSTGRWHGQYRDYPPPQDYGNRESRDSHGNSKKVSGRWEHDRFLDAGRDDAKRGRYGRGMDGDRGYGKGDEALDDRWGSAERRRDPSRSGARDESQLRYREYSRRANPGEAEEHRSGSPGRQTSDRTWKRRDERYGPSPWMDDRQVDEPLGRERGWAQRTYVSGGGDRGRQDRWKHDLFDEVNKSPSPQKDVNPTDSIEALLAA